MDEESILKDYCLPRSHHCLQKDSAAYADDSLLNKDYEFPLKARASTKEKPLTITARNCRER